MIWRQTTFLFVGLTSGWVGFQASDRDMPTVIHEMQVVHDVVHPGDQIRFEYRATRLRSCQVHVERFIFLPGDPASIRLVLMPLDFPAGVLPVGDDPFATTAQLPRDVEEGPAFYRTLNSYVCNFTHYLWPIVDRPRDIHFRIER